jgi:hypothetical protein
MMYLHCLSTIQIALVGVSSTSAITAILLCGCIFLLYMPTTTKYKFQDYACNVDVLVSVYHLGQPMGTSHSWIYCHLCFRTTSLIINSIFRSCMLTYSGAWQCENPKEISSLTTSETEQKKTQSRSKIWMIDNDSICGRQAIDGLSESWFYR